MHNEIAQSEEMNLRQKGAKTLKNCSSINCTKMKFHCQSCVFCHYASYAFFSLNKKFLKLFEFI